MEPSGVELSIVVPVYNEERRLAETLRRFQEYLSAKPFTYEILLVVDGPTDNSLQVAKSMASEIKHLKVTSREVNHGKGYAVRCGMLQARGRIRLFSDADNSTDIAHFDKIEPLLDRGYDLVICSRDSRDVRGARQAVPQPWYKRLMGNLGNLFVQLIAVRGIWDTQCGFKAFRDYAAQEIFSRAMIDGWGFDIEVLALARALNYKIGIVPAHWVNKPGSHVRLLSYLQVLSDTVKTRRGLSRGKYRA